MLVAFALQEDTGIPLATQRVWYTVESVRRFIPEARIVQLTNETFPGLSIVDEVLRFPNKGDFIQWAFGALLVLCERRQPILQIATDVLIQRDVRGVFDESFDVAATRYPTRDRTDGAYCGDVNFINRNGGLVFMDALNIYQNYARQDGWDGGQRAFLDATHQTTMRVKELDAGIYCRTPRDQNEDLSNAAIVHFRGHRKIWMIPYAEGVLKK